MIYKYRIKNEIMVGISFILIFSALIPAGISSNQVTFLDEPPGIVWSKTYGGVNADDAMSVQQTFDGGYIVAGSTESYGAGDWDAWLIKTDGEGNELWNKTYGGIYEDIADCVIETSDGGYAVAGYTEYSGGKYELWIIKTDENGTEVWSKNYRNGDKVFGNCIIETEQGYVVVGYANDDAWLVGIDENGEMIWNSTFGGIKPDWGNAVIHDDNGGYVIVGTTYSFGYGHSDIWFVKTNETGGELWNKTFGGAGDDIGQDIIQTNDGGFAVTGGITTSGGWKHMCLIKTDENGSESWGKIYETNDTDCAYSLIQTVDGDYLIAGNTISFDPEIADALVIKADENGNEVWNVSFGGEEYNAAISIVQSNDGGFITAGKYSNDAWLVKIGYIPTVTITKPKNGLYFMNFFIRPYLFRSPLIIGPIDVEVEVVDHKYEIEKVEFYVNDELMAIETSEPYGLRWNEMAFGRYEVKVVAYNSNGYTGVDEIRVWKFF